MIDEKVNFCQERAKKNKNNIEIKKSKLKQKK